MTDPTLTAMRAADEAARTACHAAYDAPRTPSSVYDRIGTLHALLSKVEQLAEHLAADARSLARTEGLYSTDDTAPADHLDDAVEQLLGAKADIGHACARVNEAWSQVSPIGVRP